MWGFVQGGLSRGVKTDNLVSLGSIAYQPMFVFYRGSQPMVLLSELKRQAHRHWFVGKRHADTGKKNCWKMNGIESGEKNETDRIGFSDDAAKDLLSGKIDAVFMMTEVCRRQDLAHAGCARSKFIYIRLRKPMAMYGAFII